MAILKLPFCLHKWCISNFKHRISFFVRHLSNFGNGTVAVSHLEVRGNDHDAVVNASAEDRTRRIPRNQDEYKEQMKLRPVQPGNPRFLRVAIIGDPNSGKSTLTNKLTNWRVCSISSKVHTTRRSSNTVLNVGDTQIEFTDTPGTLSFEQSVKHPVESTLVHDPLKSSFRADMLLVLVDAANIYTRSQISSEIRGILLKHSTKQSILVLNKTDLVRDKSKLLEVARSLCNGILNGQPYGTKNHLFLPNELKEKLFKRMNDSDSTRNEKKPHKGWSGFSKMFMVSALENTGVSSILSFLLDSAPSRPWKYHSSIVARESPEELAKRVVREKLLDVLKQEIGYILTYQINYWEIDESDILKISIIIKCPKKNLVSMVIGPGGKFISKLSVSAQQELCNVFHCEVRLHLGVKYDLPYEKRN